jgi:MFS family permease
MKYLSLSHTHGHKMRPEQTILTIDEAIDRIGNGPFQQKILIAAGSCFMADAMEVMLLSFLALTLENDWKLTKDQTASIVSLVFIGAMVGNLILGPAGDRLGRQPIFYICSLIIGIFGIVTSFVHSYVALILVRFVVGIGLGGLTVPFDILAEFTPTKQRSKYLILIELFWTLGSFLTVLVAYGTLGQGISWRVFVSLCAMPCFLSMLLVKMFVPESPHWLVAQGRTDEALKVLYRGALENGNDPVSLFPPGCMLLVDGMDHSTRSDAIISTEQSLNDPKNEKRRHPYHSYPFSVSFLIIW